MPDAIRSHRSRRDTPAARGLGPLPLLLFVALAASGCVRAATGATTARRGPPPVPIAALATGSGSSLAARDELAALRLAIDSMIDAPAFSNAQWGVLIVDPARGDTLYSRNAGKLFMPASNQKLVTGAVALALLGPDYRWTTRYATNGRLRGATIDGDLVVVGHGDPTVSDHMLGDAMTPLRAVADTLYARGIRRLTGAVIRGGDAFPDAPLGYGWAWDDLDEAYAAGVDELTWNEGFTRVIVHGDGHIRTAPGSTYPRVRVRRTSAADVAPRTLTGTRDMGTGDIVLSGPMPRGGDSAVLEVALMRPATAYLAALAQALTERGIRVGSGTTTAPSETVADTARLMTLLTVLSPPVREMMPVLQKPSQNQMTELLYKTMGLELTGVGTADSARAVVERQLRAWGVDSQGAVVRDGSGLSRHDYITPASVVRVLDAMRRDSAFTVFYNALPIAGVDGTIRARMRGTLAQGNVRAKTGYIDRARSLSGYVTTADGRMLLFSLLSNNWTTSVRDVERVQDAIAVHLASLGGVAPSSAAPAAIVAPAQR